MKTKSCVVFLLTAWMGAVLALGQDRLLELAGEDDNADDFYLVFRHETRALDQIRDDNGRSLLHLAARAHNQHNAFMLLQRRADVNARDAEGRTPLHDAVANRGRSDSRVIWEMLCLRGADINATDREGLTPLAVAISARNAQAVELLLWLGAELEPVDVPEKSRPRVIARRINDSEILALLDAVKPEKPAGERPPPQPLPETAKRDFFAAAKQADFARLDALLEAGVSIDVQDETGRTALYRAAEANQDAVVVRLLLLGADPNMATPDGLTPLRYITGLFGFTFDKMREMLIAAGANPKREAKDGFSAVAASARNGNVHGLQTSIWTGIEPELKTSQGTLMHLASKASRQETIDLLRLYGVEEALYVGDTPEWKFLDAVKRGDEARTAELLDAGQAVDTVDENGSSALMQAIAWAKPPIAQLLLDRKANVNYVNPKSGWTPLFMTVIWNSPWATKLRLRLLDAGANPNVRALKDDQTPLLRTIPPSGQSPNVEQLLRYGAEVNAADKAGRTPLKVAEEFKNEWAIALLRQYGAR